MVNMDTPTTKETVGGERDDQKWRLGHDLSTYDCILPAVTFDDLILTLHCNCRKDTMDPCDVMRELKTIIEGHWEDAMFLVKKNADRIIEYARNYYRD